MDVRAVGLWTAGAGALLQVNGFALDAIAHGTDPTLAEREGVFSFSNIGHLMVYLGIALVMLGVATAVFGPKLYRPGGDGRPGLRAAQFFAPLAALMLVLSGGYVANASSLGSGSGHSHGSGESAAGHVHADGTAHDDGAAHDHASGDGHTDGHDHATDGSSTDDHTDGHADGHDHSSEDVVLVTDDGHDHSSSSSATSGHAHTSAASTTGTGDGHDHGTTGSATENHDHGTSGATTDAGHNHDPGTGGTTGDGHNHDPGTGGTTGDGHNHDPSDPTQPHTSCGHGHGGAATTPLTPAQQVTLDQQLGQARNYALQFPTAADAKKAGYQQVTHYYCGIGAHYLKIALFDDVFDPAKPEILLYDGDGPDAKLVGINYYVKKDGSAPDGFVGDHDQWHRHLGLCLKIFFVIGPETWTDEQCKAAGGYKQPNNDKIWLLHAWVVPGYEHPTNVFEASLPSLPPGPWDVQGITF